MSCTHNQDRADRGRTAIALYEGDDDFESNAADLLADILHAMAEEDPEGVEALLNRALRAYGGEADVDCSYVRIDKGWHACGFCQDLAASDE